MRMSNLPIIACLVLCLLPGITAESVRADGWMVVQARVYQTYYAATPVTFYHSCHPVYAQPTYSAPSGYAQQTYAPQTDAPQTSHYPDARARPSAPRRPTTTATVNAYDNYFEPKTINVQPGTTVRFVNRGRHAHTVTAGDDRWDSGNIAPGASYTVTFQRPGAYEYYCRHHTDDRMRGTVTVGADDRSNGNMRGAPGGSSRDGGYGRSRGNGRNGARPSTY